MSRSRQWSAGDLFGLAGVPVGQGGLRGGPRAGPGLDRGTGRRARPRRARPRTPVMRGYTWARQAFSLLASGAPVEKYSECDF
jgi:hypothetical protein